MANESFANIPQVSVAGRPLPADVAATLIQASVEGSRNLPDVCVLRFRDPDRRVLSKAGITIGAVITVAVNTAEPGGAEQLMSGEVTAIELDLSADGSFTEVRGLDLAHRLFRGRRVAAYPNMGIAEIVRTVTERAGLTPGTIDSVDGVGDREDIQLNQDNISDWQFLSRLAAQVGAQVTASDGTLHFRLPTPPGDAPPQTERAGTNPQVLEAGKNLAALRACISAAEQVPEVQARGWDAEHKQALTARATPNTAGQQVPGLDPVGLANGFAAPPYLAAGTTFHSQSHVQAHADALAGQLGGAAAELEGVAKGNPVLRPGIGVSLTGVGEPFAGGYTLTSARHVFNERDGYVTAFTVSGRQERSLYGLVSRGGDRRRPPALSGLVPGVVSDVRDPTGLGRVKLTFPWLSDELTTGWARTVQAAAGANRGAWLMPEVGDEVLVGFIEDDFDAPVVIGGLYNGTDTAPSLSVPTVDDASGEVAVRALVSRTGHRLELVDAPDGDGVLLATGDGAMLLKLDKAGNVVELSASGPVKITGDGVKVDAGSGELELSGAQVSVNGRTSIELSGQQIKIDGQAAAELTASGSVTVRGGVVRIN